MAYLKIPTLIGALVLGGLGTPCSWAQGAGPAPAAAPVAPDEAQHHLMEAERLMAGEQFQQALRAYQAAYALRQSPLLLLAMGKAHQRLGDRDEALRLYERFLYSGAGTPEERAFAEAQLRLLGGLRLAPMAPMGAPLGYTPQPYRPPSRRNGLIAGGSALLGAGYLAGVITASFFVDSSYDTTSRTAAGVLFVPVLGPFISALVYREAAWSFPWAMVDGLAQVGGLAMIIVGARQPAQPPSPTGLIVGGSVLAGLGYLGAVLAGSFGVSSKSQPGGATSGVLFVPVLGPFISAFMYRTPAWSVNWALVDGVAQAGGLAMAIVGGVKLRRGQRLPFSWQLAPLGTAGGSGLAVAGTF